MNLDIELFDEAISKASFAPRFFPINTQTETFFTKYNVPNELVKLLTKHSYYSPVQFFEYFYFDQVNDFEAHNTEKESIKCIENRLLSIGSGCNGDPIVINLDTFEVGYIFHDRLWENEEFNLDKIYVNMELSLGEFFLTAVNDPYNFPVDAYQARYYMDDSE